MATDWEFASIPTIIQFIKYLWVAFLIFDLYMILGFLYCRSYFVCTECFAIEDFFQIIGLIMLGCKSQLGFWLLFLDFDVSKD